MVFGHCRCCSRGIKTKKESRPAQQPFPFQCEKATPDRQSGLLHASCASRISELLPSITPAGPQRRSSVVLPSPNGGRGPAREREPELARLLADLPATFQRDTLPQVTLRTPISLVPSLLPPLAACLEPCSHTVARVARLRTAPSGSASAGRSSATTVNRAIRKTIFVTLIPYTVHPALPHPHFSKARSAHWHQRHAQRQWRQWRSLRLSSRGCCGREQLRWMQILTHYGLRSREVAWCVRLCCVRRPLSKTGCRGQAGHRSRTRRALREARVQRSSQTAGAAGAATAVAVLLLLCRCVAPHQQAREGGGRQEMRGMRVRLEWWFKWLWRIQSARFRRIAGTGSRDVSVCQWSETFPTQAALADTVLVSHSGGSLHWGSKGWWW